MMSIMYRGATMPSIPPGLPVGSRFLQLQIVLRLFERSLAERVHAAPDLRPEIVEREAAVIVLV
jgi:hypothetical protein